jgi:hypothetical protein
MTFQLIRIALPGFESSSRIYKKWLTAASGNEQLHSKVDKGKTVVGL